jgi:hypothetical protein
MKTMKKTIQYIAAATLGILCLGGCSSFLDTQNLLKKDTSNFPANETDARQMITGIYAVMNSNIKNITEDPFMLFDLASDDRLGGGSQSNVEAQSADRLMNRKVSWLEPCWKYRYMGINRANSAIENMDRVTEWSNDNVRGQLLCEAYFLRAFYYFNLAQVFGSVPLVITTEPVNYPKADPADLYAQIASDLKTAIEIGPDLRYPTFGEGHVSKWAAEALMARVWLFYTGFYGKTDLPLAEGGSVSKSQVVTWLEDCIEHSGFGLVSDQRNLWPYSNQWTAVDYQYDIDNNLAWETNENKEIMFAIKMGNAGYSDSHDEMRFNRLPEYYGLRSTTAAAFPFNCQGYSNGPVCRAIWDDWGNDPDYAGDVRRVGSICDRLVELPDYPGDKAKEVENTDLLAKKYVGCGAYDHENGDKLLMNFSFFLGAPNSKQEGQMQPLIWIRFADVLLMHSELTDGKVIYDGKSGLNAVRARAGLGDKPYSLALLKKERRYELCFEAIRWNDLRRWHDVSDIVRNQEGNPIKNEQSTGYYHFTNDFMQRYEDTGGGFFKIPESQITLSEGVLVQNPGWGEDTNWAKGDLPYFKK